MNQYVNVLLATAVLILLSMVTVIWIPSIYYHQDLKQTKKNSFNKCSNIIEFDMFSNENRYCLSKTEFYKRLTMESDRKWTTIFDPVISIGFYDENNFTKYHANINLLHKQHNRTICISYFYPPTGGIGNKFYKQSLVYYLSNSLNCTLAIHWNWQICPKPMYNYFNQSVSLINNSTFYDYKTKYNSNNSYIGKLNLHQYLFNDNIDFISSIDNVIHTWRGYKDKYIRINEYFWTFAHDQIVWNVNELPKHNFPNYTKYLGFYGNFNNDNNKTLDLLNGKKFDKPVAIEFGIGGKYMIGFEYTKGIQIEVKPADRSIHYEKYKLYNVMVGGAGGGIMIRKITINKGGNRFLSSIFRTYSGKAETPTNLGNFGDIKDNKMGEFNFSNGIGDGISNIPGGDVDIKIYDQQMSHLIAKGDGKYIGLTSSPTFLTIGALLNLIDFIPTVTDELTKFMNKYMYVTALFGSSQKVTRGDILLDDILENCDDSNNSIYSNNNTKFIEPVGRYELVSTMYKKSWTSPDNDNGNWSIETSNLKTELLLNIYDEMNENTRYWIGQNVPTSNDWYNYTITATVSFLDDDDEGSIGILFGISEEKAYYFSIESQYVVIGIFTANGYKEI
eukprot:70763_1